MVAVSKKDAVDKNKDQSSENDAEHILNLSNKLLSKLTSSFLTDQVKNPEKVTALLAERNKLTDVPIEVIDFVNLESINLSYNCLKTFPSVVCELVCLREIVLVGCAIQVLPLELENLIFLEKLVLDLNQLRKIGDSLYGVNSLTTLSLGMNYFSVFFALLPQQVRKLNLDNNHLTCFPDSILDLPNLQCLNLSFNRIQEIPYEIDVLQKLEQFLIVKNRLSALPSTICNLKKLKLLDISNNHIEVLPGNFSNLEVLEELNLVNNPIIQPPRHICDHGIDAIKAFQDCLKKQLYEPCNRALKVFILGSSRSGKSDLFNFLSGQTESAAGDSNPKPASCNKAGAKKFTQYATNTIDNLNVTLYKMSGKSGYGVFHQLFFTRNALYIVCVNLDKFKSSSFKNLVLSWMQLVLSVIPEAMILILPSYSYKGQRSPISKLQFDKNAQEIQSNAASYLKKSRADILNRMDLLRELKKDHGFELWIQQRLKFLERLTLVEPKILSGVHHTKGAKKNLSWKISKNERCGQFLLTFLKDLTHSEEFFACNLQDEVQSSWKTLEKLILSYRKKNSGRLYLNRNDIMEPAVQIGVNSCEIEEVVQFLNMHGVICMFDRTPQLKQCLFHDPKTVIDMLGSVLDVCLLDRRDDPCVQQLSPFELQSTKRELRQHGVVSEEVLQQLLRNNSCCPVDSVDFNYFAALLRNLLISRKVDASNIKEVLKSRNTRSNVSRSTKVLTKQKSVSFFKKDKQKPAAPRRSTLIGRSSSQSDENVPVLANKKWSHNKRVVSYTALPDDDEADFPEEGYRNKNTYRSSFFFPWYIKQEYKPHDTGLPSDKNKVMTLWPGYMRSSLYKLQVVCIFRNFRQVECVFDRLSVSLHHLLEYRDDWRGRLSATMDGVPLLIEIEPPPPSPSSSSFTPTLSLSSRGETTYATLMWTVVIKMVEFLQKLLLEYPGMHYDLQVVCPHCIKRFSQDKPVSEMHMYPWEQLFLNLRNCDSMTDDTDAVDLKCPYMNTTERLPISLLIPQPVEYDLTFSKYFDEISPSLTRTNWRQFARHLNLTDLEIDTIRDSVAATYNFARQKELMLVYWRRLFLAIASTTHLIEACQKQGFTFLVNKLTALQSKLRAPSVAIRNNLESGSSFSVHRVSSITTDSLSNASESCQSIFEAIPPA